MAHPAGSGGATELGQPNVERHKYSGLEFLQAARRALVRVEHRARLVAGARRDPRFALAIGERQRHEGAPQIMDADLLPVLGALEELWTLALQHGELKIPLDGHEKVIFTVRWSPTLVIVRLETKRFERDVEAQTLYTRPAPSIVRATRPAEAAR